MSKETLQAIGEDTVVFGNTTYYVAENVKRFLGQHYPGEEVEITVKEIDGIPQVTFLKSAGRPAGAPQGGYRPPQYQQPYAAPYTQPPQQFAPPAAPRPPQAPAGKDDGLYVLAAAIAVAYQIDINQIKEFARALKSA